MVGGGESNVITERQEIQVSFIMQFSGTSSCLCLQDAVFFVCLYVYLAALSPARGIFMSSNGWPIFHEV